jgi:class 3 adenylate cyclase
MASAASPFVCLFYFGISFLIGFLLFREARAERNPFKWRPVDRGLLTVALFYFLAGLVLVTGFKVPLLEEAFQRGMGASWRHACRQTLSTLDPWILLLAFSLWLQKYPPKKRNPLEWSAVDRALLLVWIFFFVSGIEQLELLVVSRWHQGAVAWLNSDFVRAIRPIAKGEGALVLLFLFVGLWLRHRAPEKTFFAHVVIQYAAASAAFNAYIHGAITNASSFMAGMAIGAFALLLFPPRVALPAVATFMGLTVGSTIAAGTGLIPYAPLFARSPVVQGTIDPAYLASSLTWATIVSLLVLSLMTFVLVRWRDREGKLEEMTVLLKKMFGRYLSTEVMNSLIENPSALELGGERRRVTIMMTDLRGFTALSERLEPEQVVQMLNGYFEVMVDIILRYHGTINEIIGDALLVVFGAPQEIDDRTQRTVACAIAMQNAMTGVNAANRAQGLPDIEMGIGLNESEVVVGNIGSSKRSKYAVVGSGVNMASRIESYTVGGQVLISESVKNEAGDVLRIDAQREIHPKGAEIVLRIYEVGGIGGKYNLALETREPDLVRLTLPIPVSCTPLEGKRVNDISLDGSLTRLSEKGACIGLKQRVDTMTNLKINLSNVPPKLAARDVYAKVVQHSGGKVHSHVVRFTSVPPEIDAYFQALLRYDAEKKPAP